VGSDPVLLLEHGDADARPAAGEFAGDRQADDAASHDADSAHALSSVGSGRV
jgi:hypothetical protein